MIKVDHLHKKYGSFTAVKDLVLDIPAGELFCFLGPNGAGKTTTIKCMTGLLRPTSGSITIGGHDIVKKPLEAKRIMGYIPDMPYLYDRLTSIEFFEFMGELYGIPRQQVLKELPESFGFFGLDDHRNSLVRDLSHGLRQRLIYSATFLHNPKVLFVDEPLIGLDPYTIRLIKDFLREKTREGMTIFLTTHILSLAQDIADRIGIIMNGELITIGDFETLQSTAGIDGGLEDVFIKLTAGMDNRHLH
jgi:ABC-2 type transport system ATP-binding protein